MPDRLVEVVNDISWLPAGSSAEVWLGDDDLPDSLCPSAFTLPFDDGGCLVLADVRSRGADICGGHVEPGETPKEAAVREAFEEAGVQIRILRRIGHLRLIVPAPPAGFRYPAPVSFQPFYLAQVEHFGERSMPEECGPPFRLPPLMAAYDSRFRLHRDLIIEAVRLHEQMQVVGPPSVGPSP